MNDHHSPFLTSRANDCYQIRSRDRLCQLLDLSSPYNRCLADAPTGKYAPQCSNRINPNKRAQVEVILCHLTSVPFPSTQARIWLEKLSSCAVCGITGNHQFKAPQVYKKWCKKLWDEYMLFHDLEPEHCSKPPEPLSDASWQAQIEELVARYHPIEESDQDSDASASDDGDDTSPDSDDDSEGETPDTTISTLGEDFLSSGNASAAAHGHNRSGSPSIYSASPVVQNSTPSSTTPAPRPAAGPSSAQRNVRSLLMPQLASSRLPSSASAGPSNAQPVLTLPLTPSRPSNAAAPAKADPAMRPLILPSLASSAPLRPSAGSSNGRPAISSSKPLRPIPKATFPVYRDEQAEPSASKPSNSNTTRGLTSQALRELDSNAPALSASRRTAAALLGTQDSCSRSSHQSASRTDEARNETAPVNAVAAPVVLAEGNDEPESSASEYIALPSEPEASAPADDKVDDETETVEDSLPFFTLADDEIAEEASLSSPQSTRSQALIPFKPYPQLPPLRWYKDLLYRLPKTVAKRNNVSGWIYCFERTNQPGYLKLGYTNDRVIPRRPRPHPVDHRLSQWEADCGHPITEVFRVHIPHTVERIEKLIHVTLREKRFVEDPPCGPCSRRAVRRGRPAGGSHSEWFEVDAAEARRVVDLWRDFSAQRPYDKFGRLVDFWSAMVEDNLADADEENTVGAWVGGLPGMIDMLRREELASLPMALGRLSLL